MKLYFYFLDTRNDNCIRMEECEAEEKPKTYKLIKELYSFYGSIVKKSEIGKPTGWRKDTVILTEKNAERAAEVFIHGCEYDISASQRRIKEEENEIEKIKGAIKNIERWMSENAEQ